MTSFEPGHPIGRFLVSGFGVLALLGAACGYSSQPSGTVSKGPATGDAVQLVADDRAFVPNSVQLPAGEQVTIEIRNEDGMAHDFAIESLELNTGIIDPGRRRRRHLRFPMTSPNSYARFTVACWAASTRRSNITPVPCLALLLCADTRPRG